MDELEYPGTCIVAHCENVLDCHPGRNRSFTRTCKACIKSIGIFASMSADRLDASEFRAALILGRIHIVRKEKREALHGVNDETVVVGGGGDDWPSGG